MQSLGLPGVGRSPFSFQARGFQRASSPEHSFLTSFPQTCTHSGQWRALGWRGFQSSDPKDSSLDGPSGWDTPAHCTCQRLPALGWAALSASPLLTSSAQRRCVTQGRHTGRRAQAEPSRELTAEGALTRASGCQTWCPPQGLSWEGPSRGMTPAALAGDLGVPESPHSCSRGTHGPAPCPHQLHCVPSTPHL